MYTFCVGKFLNPYDSVRPSGWDEIPTLPVYLLMTRLNMDMHNMQYDEADDNCDHQICGTKNCGLNMTDNCCQSKMGGKVSMYNVMTEL